MMVNIAELVILLLISIISDIKMCKIKNQITFSFMLLGVITNFSRKGIEGLAFSLAGCYLPIALLFVLYVLKMLGAGDIKLFGAVGSIMGYNFVLKSILLSFLYGGIICTGLLIARKNAEGRFKYFIAYIKSCFLTLRPLSYDNAGDMRKDSKFRFTYASVPATLFLLLYNGFGGIK